MALKDYENDTHVQLCYREGCDYIFNAVAFISSKSHLELDVLYLGGMHLHQEIDITEFNIFFGDFNSKFKPAKPIRVDAGIDRVTIPIPDVVRKDKTIETQ